MASRKKNGKPLLELVAGPNGSGKSTFALNASNLGVDPLLLKALRELPQFLKKLDWQAKERQKDLRRFDRLCKQLLKMEKAKQKSIAKTKS